MKNTNRNRIKKKTGDTSETKGKPSKRGGARPGAGRPKGPDRVPFYAEILPGTKDEIAKRAEILGLSQGGFLDWLVFETRARKLSRESNKAAA